MDYRIYPPLDFIDTNAELPLSKSVSNRALIINALTPGATPLEEVAACDDTRAMTEALSSADSDTIDIGAAGTAMRFLTAFFASRDGRTVTLDGSARMRQRPIGQLVTALREAGADITYTEAEGFPPLLIKGRKLAGGEVEIDGAISSQYISALLMAAPVMENGLTLKITGEIPSMPYIRMTLALMERAGAATETGNGFIKVAPGGYKRRLTGEAEKDWSAASYWYEIAALSSGTIRLGGLKRDSLQGDSRCAEIFEMLGVVTESDSDGITLSPSPEMHSRLEIDLADQPDLAQTVAVTAAMLGVPFRLTGLASLKIKETDRLEALRAELDKLGITVETERDETLVWEGRRHPVFEIPQIDTYQDHRMALALAPVALYCPQLVVKDIDVVNKSYPGYWDDLRKAGFTLQDSTEEPLEIETGEEEE